MCSPVPLCTDRSVEVLCCRRREEACDPGSSSRGLASALAISGTRYETDSIRTAFRGSPLAQPTASRTASLHPCKSNSLRPVPRPVYPATSTLCHELEPDFGGSSMIHAQTNSPLCMTRWQSSPLASASFNSGSAQIQAFSLPPLQPNTMVAYWSRVTCR